MDTEVEIRLVIVLAAMFFLPGAALLVLSRQWQRWSGLQRCIVAAGLSVAFYPILFYVARFLLPQVALNATVLTIVLLASGLATGWGWWRHRIFPLRLAPLEWVAVIILGLTLASRFWFAHAHPYPAWSDSMHHTLLTKLTAESGQLPHTLEPYFPNVLNMYHLGLYAISGTAMMLSGVPAHSALLWTAQFLNGLCGIGIYLVLDRLSGRTGAIFGLAIAGLFSAHPALWANWGRFTQLSALVLLPVSLALTLETISFPSIELEGAPLSRERFMAALLTALCTAAIFLLHFRVAAFYAVLLGVTAAVALWRGRSSSQRRTILRLLGITGGLSLVIILPVLWQAADRYLSSRLATPVEPGSAQLTELQRNYFSFPLSSLPYLAAPIWLIVAAGLATLVGIVRRNRLIIINLIWVTALIALGNFYRLNIPVLNVTNLGAILIMFYLSLSLITGAAVEEVLPLLPPSTHRWIGSGLIALVLLAGLPAARIRATSVETERHFITSQDVAAMEWIRTNVPEDATFAINTFFWLPAFAHGTDAGFWIPYFTGRHIVTSSMISDGAPPSYRQRVLAQSTAAEALESDLSALDDLSRLGVEYIYIGAKGDFSGPGLQRDFLMQSERVELLYEIGGAVVMRIR